MPTIFWAGDSTVQYNSILTYPQCGIGQVMHLFLNPTVRIENKAVNGRSTKSFIDQGRLEDIANHISEGDFLFIQFAHNDEKITDSARYTEPFGSYSENLEKFVNVARDKGAYPVIITSIERCCFDEQGKLGPGEHGEYIKAAVATAQRLDVPVVDLYTRSRRLLSDIGPVEARKLHVYVQPGIYPKFPLGKDDHTHLNYHGAVLYASYIAEGLKKLGGVYADILLDFKTYDEVVAEMRELGEEIVLAKEDVSLPFEMK